MSEDNPVLEGPPPAETLVALAGAAPVPIASPRGLPPWLPYFLLAVVPAVVVAIVVYLFAGGGGGGSGAAGLLEYIVKNPSSGEEVSAYKGELPPSFPSNFPVYGGAKITASFLLASADGSSYLAFLSTPDSTDKVYQFYVKRLAEDPWQVEAARSSEQVAGFTFSSPEDADVGGQITVYHSDLDGTTSIIISFQDISPDGAPASNEQPFVIGQSRALPPGFPDDLPIYKANASVVIDAFFELNPGSRTFYVSFLTKDSQGDVMDFYTEEFEKRGWTVSDSADASGFALGIDFSEGGAQALTGQILADDFDKDPSYTKVDLFVEVTGSRNRGN